MTQNNPDGNLINDVVDVAFDGITNTKELNNDSPSEETSSSTTDPERDAPSLLLTEIPINNDLYCELKSLLSIKYNENEEIINNHLRSEIDSVFKIGLRILQQGLEATSSTTLIFNNRPPRTEVLLRLAKIAYMFANPHDCYPHFRANQMLGILKIVLGDVDTRTKDKYIKCIKDNSVKNITYGTFNVETFCQQISLHFRLKAKQEAESKW